MKIIAARNCRPTAYNNNNNNNNNNNKNNNNKFHLHDQIEPLDDLVFADTKDKRRIVVDHGAVLELALGLDQYDISLHGTSPLLQSVHKDALLDVPVLCDVSPVVLNTMRNIKEIWEYYSS